jgi:DNA-binding response OmpR family regulator
VKQAPRIALIETDDLIRQLASRWLKARGYAVLCTSAQRLRAEQLHQPLLLIVANVAQPRNAASLVRSLRAIHAAPILLVSARFHRAQGPSTDLAAQFGAEGVLAKPYTADELLAAVAAALAQRGS